MRIKSNSGAWIRITDERLRHIFIGHPEVKGCEDMLRITLEDPDMIQEGDEGALMAIRKFSKTPVSRDKFMVVVYKETRGEGFVITAYFTRRPSKRRRILWSRP